MNKKKTEEYEEIYKQYEGSGFKFDYSKKRLGKSKQIFRDEVSAIDPSKRNNDGMPLFVECRACGTYMDFKEGPKKLIFDSWRECPVCGVKIKEETLYNRLERENADWLRRNAGEKPEGCKKCGGPRPDCESGCKLFED